MNAHPTRRRRPGAASSSASCFCASVDPAAARRRSRRFPTEPNGRHAMRERLASHRDERCATCHTLHGSDRARPRELRRHRRVPQTEDGPDHRRQRRARRRGVRRRARARRRAREPPRVSTCVARTSFATPPGTSRHGGEAAMIADAQRAVRGRRLPLPELAARDRRRAPASATRETGIGAANVMRKLTSRVGARCCAARSAASASRSRCRRSRRCSTPTAPPTRRARPLPKRFGVFFWGNGVQLDAGSRPPPAPAGRSARSSQPLAPGQGLRLGRHRDEHQDRQRARPPRRLRSASCRARR